MNLGKKKENLKTSLLILGILYLHTLLLRVFVSLLSTRYFSAWLLWLSYFINTELNYAEKHASAVHNLFLRTVISSLFVTKDFLAILSLISWAFKVEHICNINATFFFEQLFNNSRSCLLGSFSKDDSDDNENFK